MLLSHWLKCVAGDHRYARKNVDVESEETPEDLEAWYCVYDTYISRFGFNPKYERILKAMKKKALLELKWVITRDPFLRTLITIEEEKLKLLRKDDGEGSNVERLLVHLSKWYGQRLRANEITVLEFNLICEEYGKANHS